MPEFDYVEKHRIVVISSAKIAFDAAKNMDLSHSQIIALLFGVRNLYGRAFSLISPNTNSLGSISLSPSLNGLIENAGFIFLDETCDKEFVLGLIGMRRFEKQWLSSYMGAAH
jgi:hypothetical protein